METIDDGKWIFNERKKPHTVLTCCRLSSRVIKKETVNFSDLYSAMVWCREHSDNTRALYIDEDNI